MGPPDDGFRFIYADEIVGNSAFLSKANYFMGSWDIALLINGNIDGIGYGGEAFSNDGSRSDTGSALTISADYPVLGNGVYYTGEAWEWGSAA